MIRSGLGDNIHMHLTPFESSFRAGFNTASSLAAFKKVKRLVFFVSAVTRLHFCRLAFRYLLHYPLLEHYSRLEFEYTAEQLPTIVLSYGYQNIGDVCEIFRIGL